MSLLLALASCDKDNQLETSQESILEKTYELPELLKSGVVVDNEMMVFKDKESYDELSKCLETENQEYVDAYFENKANLSEAELDSVLEEDELNLFAVYDAFECYHSFYSARKQYFDAENEWMEAQGEEIDFTTKPSEKPISDRLSPFANINGEYMIGSTIYRVENDGLVYEIRNADFNTLSCIRQNNNIHLKSANNNIIIHRAEVREPSTRAHTYNNENAFEYETTCKAYRRVTKNHYWKTDYWMLCILDLDWDGYGSAAKAKVQCYKKKKNWRGKWKTKRNWRSMGAEINVDDYKLNLSADDGDSNRCIYEESKTEKIHRNWAYYVSTRVTKFGLGFRVVPGTGGGKYYLGSSSQPEFKMTW